MSSRGHSRRPGKAPAPPNPAPPIIIPSDSSPPSARRRQRRSRDPGPSRESIDVETIEEDDVQVLSSSSGFPQGRIPARRRQRPVTVDLEEDEVEEVGAGQRKNTLKSSVDPKEVILKEPTFTCPVCLNTLAEASSTICGHVFCKTCIKTSIEANKKCPICKRKLKMNNFHRVYLPAAE